ncbi:MAG: GTPase HflX [Halobacteriaceae archaeon]
MSAHGRAIVARRAATAPARTAEIERLTSAAGYEVARTFTQVRPEDGAYNLGAGKATEVGEAVAKADAELLVVDNELTPTQTRNLAEQCPDGTQVMDRYRLVLELFAGDVSDRVAAMQVELATLEYDLPRVRDAVGERDHGLSKFTEKGSPIQDLERRIDELQRRINEETSAAADRRAERRAEGFDLVALAGYTNAGKSTLLHRLADSLSLDELEAGHEDLETTAAVEDRLFKTLETTTRRSTLDGRRLLLTDTVGLLDEVPHELISSFRSTISAATDADLTLVVADAAEPVDELRRKLRTSTDLLAEARRRLVVLNKTDELEPGAVEDRRQLVGELTDDPVVAASATEGSLERLRAAIQEALPAQQSVRLELPQCPESQQFIAWLHDHAVVDEVRYHADEVVVTAEARDAVLERIRRRAPTDATA